MDLFVSVLIGIGLAAACGFRVFVPLLVLSIAARTGHVPLTDDFQWVASLPALIAFATATVVEIGAYYVPWLDHTLDTLATPAAMVAGVIATAAVVGDLPPVLRWAIAVLAGGGLAGTVQGATVLTRLKSGAVSAGFANPVVASAELAGSVATSVLAVVLPVAAIVLVVLALYGMYRASRRLFFRRRPIPTEEFELKESVDDRETPS